MIWCCRAQSESACIRVRACVCTCMRFMASRIWSRWWAELNASSLISVSFSSFSLSSFFSCRIISASASVHSHSLHKHTPYREEVGHNTVTHHRELQNTGGFNAQQTPGELDVVRKCICTNTLIHTNSHTGLCVLYLWGAFAAFHSKLDVRYLFL